MKNLMLAISLLSALCAFGQQASFKEIKRKPSPEYYNTQENTIVFPIIVTGNPHIDALINTQISTSVLSNDDSTAGLEKVLNESIQNGLTDISYKITFNRNGLLSFFINAQGCGAHCSSWQTYFNFDLKTGKPITIEDVFRADKTGELKQLVFKEKVSQLKKYKEEERLGLQNQNIDSATYEWAILQVDDNCINSVSIETFSLLPDAIKIIDDCEFPYVIRSRQPVIELQFPFRDMDAYLQPAFSKLLR